MEWSRASLTGSIPEQADLTLSFVIKDFIGPSQPRTLCSLFTVLWESLGNSWEFRLGPAGNCVFTSFVYRG